MNPITAKQSVHSAIACARDLYTHPEWARWADRWMQGEDIDPKQTLLIYRIVEIDTEDNNAANAAAYAVDAALQLHYGVPEAGVKLGAACSLCSAQRAVLGDHVPINPLVLLQTKGSQ